ncbi:HET-domain-containing protein [Hyaloscypha hepaticicola]|uniref:HET-domain-containing protein n=1 Tax=Hyaloscypha hepaticicola TaxID=2082293 RepID=A0A2J6Q309_9HELO|nr:HET-domain-containing protein [Hyaloscypha hepaticicola]
MPLPKRVIYIGRTDTTSDPYLLETDNEIGAWVALSHCWGQGASFTTTTTNLLERKRGIPFADFPATFQDAITISRRLGIKNLWIDSLCIIQDSASDWLEQSRQMKQVYSNAIVTLVAEASEDSHSGIFTSANAGRAKPVHVPFHDGRGNYSGSLYSQAFHQYFGVAGCYEPGPLSSRAWALQEDVLSQRILRYASDQLFWACRTSFHPESNPSVFHESQDISDPRNFRRRTQSSDTEIEKFELLSFWYTIVRQYRKRQLTFEKDKFPALSGIAMEMAERIKYTYVAGLWLEDIHAGLLWSTIGTDFCRTPEYVAPSWSWACLTQLRSSYSYPYPTAHDQDYSRMNIAEILRVDVSTVSGDPYGQVTSGMLRVRGPSKNITYWNAKNFNSAAMELRFDVGKEELDGDILCMQILQGRARDEIFGGISESRSTSCILMKTTIEVEEYQRIGVAYIKEGSMELEYGWEMREVTVI